MASEAVKKILEAEALSEKKNAEARKKRDEIRDSASGNASLAIQKKLSEAHSEIAGLKADFDKKLELYQQNAEKECEDNIETIKKKAEKNMASAVEEVISRFF